MENHIDYDFNYDDDDSAEQVDPATLLEISAEIPDDDDDDIPDDINDDDYVDNDDDFHVEKMDIKTEANDDDAYDAPITVPFPKSKVKKTRSKKTIEAEKKDLPFKCEICAKGFSSQRSLRGHRTKTHKVWMNTGSSMLQLGLGVSCY